MMATDFKTTTGVYYGDIVNEDIVDAVRTAKKEAAELRTMFDKMAPLERAIAARSEQFKAIRRLVEAVEAL